MGRPGEILPLSGLLEVRLRHAAGAGRRRCGRLSRRGREAAGRVCLGEAIGVRPPDGAPAAPRRHAARRVSAQPGGARVRRGALPAVLGHSDQCRPGDQHPHASRSRSGACGLRIRRIARTGGRDRAGLRRRAGLRLGRRPPCEPVAPTLARHAEPDEHAVRARADLQALGAAEPAARRQSAPERVDLVRPSHVPADIVATLLYPVTDRPFRELYEIACGWSDRAARRGDRRGARLAHASAMRSWPDSAAACTLTTS